MTNVPEGTRQAATIAALTGDAIQRSAIRHLDLMNYVKVTLMPEAN